MRIWNRIRSRRESRTFKSTLILYFSLFIVIPILILVFTSFNVVSANNLRNFRGSIQNNLSLVKASTLQFFDQVNGIAKSLLSSSQMRSVLESDTGEASLATNQIVTLNSLVQNYNVVTYNGSVPLETQIYLINKPEYTLFHSSSNVRNIQEVSNEPWFQSLPVYFDYQVVPDGEGLLFVKRFYNYYGGFLSLEGILTIEIEKSYYEVLLTQFQSGAGNLTIYDNPTGTLIASDGGDALPEESAAALIRDCSGTDSRILETRDYILGGVRIPGLEWTIVSAVRQRDLNLPISEYSTMLIPLILICLLTAILLANLLSAHISQPIQYLVQSMKQVGKGNLSEQISYKRNDEFHYLIGQYNGMVGKLDALVDELYRTEQKKKEAEMASLQAQINPHFLYNTLDSITMLAMWEKNDEIIEVVSALSDFFRYSLSKGKNIIPISDELKQLESYLKIQKLRYEETLDYRLVIDSRIGSYRTIKLILQPIVENSIKHGITPTGEKGLVTVAGSLDGDDIVFEISDNGAGGDLGEINALLTDSAEANRAYGIRNVHWRIQNYYGAGYGLVYRKNEPRGITCVVRIRATTGTN